MSRTASDGFELWYEVEGTGEPLVLSGGFGLLHRQFEFVTPLLARRFSVLNWNWRGAGRSDRTQTEAVSVEAWVRDLRAVVDAAGFDRAFFWATSTGSLVQARFAELHRERVRGLVTYPQLRTEVELRRRYFVYVDVVEQLGWEAAARIFSLALSPASLASPASLEIERWEREVIEGNLTTEGFRRTIEAIAYADVSSSLAKLDGIPFCLLLGNAGPLGIDQPRVQARVDAIRELLPDAELRVIPGTGGTYCTIEKPEETADAVASFVEAHAAAPRRV